MSQEYTYQDRRSEPRVPAAFSFWYQRGSRSRRHGAWMVDICGHGAAFLVPTNAAPHLGERLTFSEMYSPSRIVREGAVSLPHSARVVRVEPSNGPTCKVAARFEAHYPSDWAPDMSDHVSFTKQVSSTIGSIPPLIPNDGGHTAPMRATVRH